MVVGPHCEVDLAGHVAVATPHRGVRDRLAPLVEQFQETIAIPQDQLDREVAVGPLLYREAAGGASGRKAVPVDGHSRDLLST